MPASARVIAFVAATAILSACGLFGPEEDCTLDARPAIRLHVVDSLSGEALLGEMRILAEDGAFSEMVQGTAVRPQPYTLAHERPGSYTVTVEREGYQLWSRAGVRVRDSECHVRTVDLTARLKR